jgi:hypothetical protein
MKLDFYQDGIAHRIRISVCYRSDHGKLHLIEPPRCCATDAVTVLLTAESYQIMGECVLLCDTAVNVVDVFLYDGTESKEQGNSRS